MLNKARPSSQINKKEIVHRRAQYNCMQVFKMIPTPTWKMALKKIKNYPLKNSYKAETGN